MSDNLSRDLYSALCAIPLIDPHSHIDPVSPASKSLDDILGYHYYTELAHSAGMGHGPLGRETAPRDRVRAILGHMGRFDNTTQYSWFVEIAREFLGFTGDRVTVADMDTLFDAAQKTFAQPDWEKQVFARSKLDAIFLTNEFDDSLDGFDTSRYVPCLRTDSLVFHLATPKIRQRLPAPPPRRRAALASGTVAPRALENEAPSRCGRRSGNFSPGSRRRGRRRGQKHILRTLDAC